MDIKRGVRMFVSEITSPSNWKVIRDGMVKPDGEARARKKVTFTLDFGLPISGS